MCLITRVHQFGADQEIVAADAEYLSDGISESLINSLSQLPGVKVIARSSSFRYKGKEVDLREVANALGVEAILTGRVVQTLITRWQVLSLTVGIGRLQSGNTSAPSS